MNPPRSLSSRNQHAGALATALAIGAFAAGACAPASGPDDTPRDGAPTTLPGVVRLFADAGTLPLAPVLTHDLATPADRAHWTFLDERDEAPTPRDGDSLHLAQGETALFVTEIAPGPALLWQLDLSPTPAARSGESCEVATIVSLDGRPRDTWDERCRRATDALRERGASTMKWSRSPSARDGMEARARRTNLEGGATVALIVAARDQPLAIHGLRVAPLQSMRHHEAPTWTDVPTSRGDDLHPTPLMMHGELRTVILVDPETEVRVPFDVDVAPERLHLALGVPPDAAPAQGAVARVRLWADGAASPQHLDTITCVRASSAPHFLQDHALAWPAGVTRGVLDIRAAGQVPLVVGQPLLSGPRPAVPNLLLISIDTLRADRTTLAPGHGLPAGHPDPTPRLAARAAEGVTFSVCRSGSSYTLPSHATMLTGLHVDRHAVMSGGDRIDPSVTPPLAALLAAQGWVTAAWTGGAFLTADFGFASGFDRFSSVDPIYHPGQMPAGVRHGLDAVPHAGALDRHHSLDGALTWIRAHRDVPWFAFVHTYATHDFRPPQEDAALFDSGVETDYRGAVREQLRGRGWLDAPPGDADLAHLRDLYDATVHFVDRSLGRLLDELDADGLLDDTIVVVTSDHGDEFFEHGELRHSISLYEEMLRVPLVVRGPGIAAGRVVDTPFHQADLVPTLLALMELPLPPDLDGVPRPHLLRGEPAPSRLPATVDVAGLHTHLSVRSSLVEEGWKLVRGDVSDDLVHPARAPWELYDLAADPGEQDNLVEREVERFATLRERLETLERDHRARARSAGAVAPAAGVLEQLEALGYVLDAMGVDSSAAEDR